jgi:hypothetical protein
MFPTLSQLIHSPWGYGVSLPGPEDGMSFEIGLIPLILLAAAIFLSFKKGQKELRFLSAACIVALIFILPISLPLYKMFLGNIIDFPWRLLLCIVFATAWIGAELLHQITIRPLRKVPVILITILMVWQANNMAHTHNYYDSQNDLAFFARETGDSYGEYAPLTRATRFSSPYGKRAEFISGSGEIVTITDKSNEQTYKVKASSAGEVRINTSYFPGWVMPNDCYVTQRLATHIDDSGLMACFVNNGETTLSFKYRAPTAQRLGNLITLVAVGGYLWILFQSYYPRSTKKMR